VARIGGRRSVRDMDSGLTPPVVPAEAYSSSYYLHTCGGHEEWGASGGRGGHDIYGAALDLVALRPGETVVDIGTGRGELLAVAVARGAARAVGIEYSAAAVQLARQTLAVRDVADRAEVLLADARAVPLEDGCADLVTMLDVVEHLAPTELAATLREAHRLLRPGGRIFVHTMPTSTLRRVYSLQRSLVLRRRRHWPADPRNPFEVAMHVNEQTRGRLSRALRSAGFRPEVRYGEWVYTGYVPEGEERARRLYGRLAGFRLTRRFGVCNLIAIGHRV
jgi:ubiquinone/menaquinone biosynthesis C-methylase UbiE